MEGNLAEVPPLPRQLHRRRLAPFWFARALPATRRQLSKAERPLFNVRALVRLEVRVLVRALKLQLTEGQTLVGALNALEIQKSAANVVSGQSVLTTAEAGGSVTFTFERASGGAYLLGLGFAFIRGSRPEQPRSRSRPVRRRRRSGRMWRGGTRRDHCGIRLTLPTPVPLKWRDLRSISLRGGDPG